MMVITGERGLDRVELDIGKFAISTEKDFEKTPAKANATLAEEFGHFIFLIRSDRIVSFSLLCTNIR